LASGLFLALLELFLDDALHFIEPPHLLGIENGGKLGRPQGSVKTIDQKIEEYKDVITLLRKKYTIRDTAKLSGKSISSVQRVKKLVNL
jgi:hypothetical protein